MTALLGPVARINSVSARTSACRLLLPPRSVAKQGTSRTINSPVDVSSESAPPRSGSMSRMRWAVTAPGPP